MSMTYEAYLDEVTTLLTELHDFEDEAAIALVVEAQEAGYFSAHDDLPDMRTLEQAQKDVAALVERKENRQRTQEKQQQRQRQRSRDKKPGK